MFSIDSRLVRKAAFSPTFPLDRCNIKNDPVGGKADVKFGTTHVLRNHSWKYKSLILSPEKCQEQNPQNHNQTVITGYSLPGN